MKSVYQLNVCQPGTQNKATTMRLVLYGDTHFHPWQEADRPDRWKEMLRVLNIVHETAIREKADLIVHLGDFFLGKRTVRSDVLARAQSLFAEMGEIYNSDIPQILVAGNHDFFRGHCKLDIFNHVPNVTVWHQTIPYLDYPEDVRILIAPYGLTDLPEHTDYDILLTHSDICNGHVANGIHTATSTLPTNLLENIGRRKICFNGHYHIPQTITTHGHVPVVCVGAPYHINFSDTDGGARGIIVVTITRERCSYKRIWLNRFPHFYRKRTKDTRPKDFVQEELQDISDVATVVHDSADVIGGSNMEDAIEQYTLDMYKGQHDDEYVSEVGIKLYRGEGGGKDED